MTESPETPTTDEFDRLSGDHLRIKKNINKGSLWIKGDGCRIKITTNVGKLRVIGDGCHIHITCNLGSVEYSGDGGHIVILGSELEESDRVVYKGEGGVIEFTDKKRYVDKSETKEKAKCARGSSKGLKSRSGMRFNVVASNSMHVNVSMSIQNKFP